MPEHGPENQTGQEPRERKYDREILEIGVSMHVTKLLQLATREKYKNSHIIRTDLDEEALRQTKQQDQELWFDETRGVYKDFGGKIDYAVVDGRRLAFPGNSIDEVRISNVFNDPNSVGSIDVNEMLAEIHRVLKPEGELTISGENTPEWAFARDQQVIKDNLDKLFDDYVEKIKRLANMEVVSLKRPLINDIGEENLSFSIILRKSAEQRLYRTIEGIHCEEGISDEQARELVVGYLTPDAELKGNTSFNRDVGCYFEHSLSGGTAPATRDPLKPYSLIAETMSVAEVRQKRKESRGGITMNIPFDNLRKRIPGYANLEITPQGLDALLGEIGRQFGDTRPAMVMCTFQSMELDDTGQFILPSLETIKVDGVKIHLSEEIKPGIKLKDVLQNQPEDSSTPLIYIDQQGWRIDRPKS